MNYEIFYNRLIRIPFEKAVELMKDYEKNNKFRSFADQQRVVDLITQKGNFYTRVKEDVMQEAIINICFASEEKSMFSKVAYDELKDFPMILWIELVGVLDDKRISSFLKNFSDDMPLILIETCIINASDKLQVELIKKYSKKLNIREGMYRNLYFSVCEEARKELDLLFPDVIEDLPLLEIEDLELVELKEYLKNNIDKFKNIKFDDIVEVLLLKSNSVDFILDILLENFKDRREGLSDEKFEFLITRCIYLRERANTYYGNLLFDDDEDFEEENEKYDDESLLEIFGDRFKKLGLIRTLSLFKTKPSYDGNKLGEKIIYKFLDEAYISEELSTYVNDKVKEKLIIKFSNDIKNNTYSLEDFIALVNKIDLTKDKIIHDDFIEAMIACGQLMKDRIITDKNEYFIKLRNMFKTKTLNRVFKDGTYTEDINLNGIFYRLIKGVIPFDKFYLTNSYRGLIYLSKSGTLVDYADAITYFLTDEQVYKLDISPMLRWKKERLDEKVSSESVSFFERMSLQLLLFFGEVRAKHILESGIKGNRMENLFDGIDYKTIEINENGKGIVNIDLMEFLFGKGSVRETQSIMNKMIRHEIPEFEKYFTELCNDYKNLVEKCNGVLSVKRLIRHFEDVVLPIELRPDQYKYKMALREMNTQNVVLLEKAVGLCDRAGKREFSTIPKVKGRIGDFSYEILDYKDPNAITVGYLSHCCFVVDGISHSALEHSMTSQNGRTFVVYYKNKFLTQSWIWRNGDVVCFDSVEAGSAYHGAYQDEYNLVDVYKNAACEILYASKEAEDELQRVKVVTIGKSDYRFRDLEKVEGPVARPLEQDVYVYDSRVQYVLAGKMPEKPKYGEVGAHYRDDRSKVKFIKEVSQIDIDTLDDIFNQLYSIMFKVTGDMVPPNINDYKKIVIGDDWFITVDSFGTVDYGLLTTDDRAVEEFKKYANIFGISLREFDKGNGHSLVKNKKGVN